MEEDSTARVRPVQGGSQFEVELTLRLVQAVARGPEGDIRLSSMTNSREGHICVSLVAVDSCWLWPHGANRTVEKNAEVVAAAHYEVIVDLVRTAGTVALTKILLTRLPVGRIVRRGQ